MLTYINAKHEPVFVLNPNRSIRRILTANSPTIGMISNTQFMINQIIINPQKFF
jgi:serine phosphatase RsbU (regulator of sigma subunit)